jgi:hypothetical protein
VSVTISPATGSSTQIPLEVWHPGASPAAIPCTSGSLNGRKLGPVRLGMTRKVVRRRFPRSSLHALRYTDRFCGGANRLSVGYPRAPLLHGLTRRQRRRLRGHVVLILTSSPSYRLRGVRVDERERRAARRLRFRHPYRHGHDRWYLFRAHGVRYVVIVRRGIIRQIGIASPLLTRTRPAARRFVRTL